MEPLEMNHSAASFVRLKIPLTLLLSRTHKRKTQSNQTLPKPTFLMQLLEFIPV
jgi:hypothetical protein